MRKIWVMNSILCLILLAMQGMVSAIGISPDSIRIEFVSNFEKSYTFRTERADNVKIGVEGELAKYVSVTEDNIKKDGSFAVKVKLPSELAPGKHLIFVSLIEGGGSGTVAGIASIRTPIDIRVPYPGIYAEIGFYVRDLNINETAIFTVNINNLGKQDIDNAEAEISIFDVNKNLVEKIFTEKKAVKSNAQESLQALFNAAKHKPGLYNAIAHVAYADKSKDLESAFRIGILDIKILDYTKSFIKGEIAKFDIKAKSEWNSRIDNIYAEVKVFNGTKEVSSFKTISFSLEPWEEKTISTFWDASSLGEGAYNAEITLFYQGKTTAVKGAIELRAPKENLSMPKYLTITNLLIAAVVLLIIINIFILFNKHKKSSADKK